MTDQKTKTTKLLQEELKKSKLDTFSPRLFQAIMKYIEVTEKIDEIQEQIISLLRLKIQILESENNEK